MGSRRIVVALACAALVVGAVASAASSRTDATGHDWTRFGWSMSRTSAPTFATGITAANVKSLVKKQVQLDGTVDSSAIYLHGVQVAGATHDTFFVTTTYGKTEAIDASSGAVLWRYHADRLLVVGRLAADHDGDAGRGSGPRLHLRRVAGRDDLEARGR